MGEEFAAAVRGGGVGEGAFFGQLAADADAAEVLFKIGRRPGSENLRMAADDARGRRVSAVVEPGRLFDGVDEQIIGVDAQSGGQFLMKLRQIVSQPAAKLTLTRIDTRGALIDGLLKRGTLP